MTEHKMDCSTFMKVKCDWVSNVNGMDINDCMVVRLIQPEQETPEFDILSLIEDSNCYCVNFTKPESINDLIINISCNSEHLISKVFVSSEAKIIEQFGKTGEYVSTHIAFSSKDFNEFPMNSHSIHIETRECSLKLKQLNNANFVWIYGILVYLVEVKELSNSSLGPINMENVQHLLNSESLTTNASKLLSTLSLRESKLNSNDFLNSILKNLENSKLKNSSNSDQIMSNNFKQFEKKVEDKLNDMALQLNVFGNNIKLLNEKFDTLLIALHEQKMS